MLFTNTSAFELTGNFWDPAQATYHVGISGSSPSGTTWNDAFKSALSDWTSQTPFEFTAVDEFLDPCIDRESDGFGDGVTGVDFRESVCGSEFGENVLAVTLTAGVCFNQACTGGFQINDADIVFNSGETWDVYKGPRQGETSDFERVALHELGHALGLGHEDTGTPSIMSSFVGDLDSLQSDDISAANAVYGEGAVISTIYGIDVIQPAVSTLSGPSDSLNLSGSLKSSDIALEGKLLDLYQYRFENDSSVDLRLNSQSLDTFLYLVRIDAAQNAVAGGTFTDDNSGSGLNARIQADIQAGTYWIGTGSARVGDTGDYDLRIDSSTSSSTPSFDSFTSVYGVEVQINPNPNISGTLSSGDFSFDSRFLDLYQIELLNAAEMSITLSSSAFDTKLLVVSINPDQSIGETVLENDDIDSITTSNSGVQQVLAAGTYWIGVTSFSVAEVGDYSIQLNIIP